MAEASGFDFGESGGDGESVTVERDGFTITATLEADDDSEAPWERDDGHGPVSDWRPIDTKAPGERVLSRDGRSARFYDFAEAVKIARRDGWGAKGGEGMKPAAQAAHAAEADFKNLKAWCDDEWRYLGVVVTVSRGGVMLTGEYEHALWGIESTSGAYLGEVAEELAKQGMVTARAQLARLAASEDSGFVMRIDG